MKTKIKRSRNPFLFRGHIPTYGWDENLKVISRRNPFLFRGHIPTGRVLFKARGLSRNPFLFRGHIPT